MEMMYTISMTIVAMTFAGVLEYTGMLKSIMNQILKIAKGTVGIITATIVSCFATNATCSEQYISIVVPSRMFLRTYIKNKLHSKNLSRSLEDGGTLTSVFIPRSEEHTSELQSRFDLVCRLLLEKKNI